MGSEMCIRDSDSSEEEKIDPILEEKIDLNLNDWLSKIQDTINHDDDLKFKGFK